LKGHNALWYANRAVLWLNGNSSEVGDGNIGERSLATFYELVIVTMSPSAGKIIRTLAIAFTYAHLNREFLQF